MTGVSPTFGAIWVVFANESGNRHKRPEPMLQAVQGGRTQMRTDASDNVLHLKNT
jgi:hypothetical protein